MSRPTFSSTSPSAFEVKIPNTQERSDRCYGARHSSHFGLLYPLASEIGRSKHDPDASWALQSLIPAILVSCAHFNLDARGGSEPLLRQRTPIAPTYERRAGVNMLCPKAGRVVRENNKHATRDESSYIFKH